MSLHNSGVINMFTWKTKPAARAACMGTITGRLNACKLEYHHQCNRDHTALKLNHEEKKNSTGEGKATLADIIIRSHETIGPGRENPRTLASHH
jgi:hypothetical protein